MRSIDLDLRKRYDFDDRWKLFSENAPDDLTGSKNNKDRIPIGSVVLVSQVSSRTVPRVQNFAGILVSVKRNGIIFFLDNSFFDRTGNKLYTPSYHSKYRCRNEIPLILSIDNIHKSAIASG